MTLWFVIGYQHATYEEPDESDEEAITSQGAAELEVDMVSDEDNGDDKKRKGKKKKCTGPIQQEDEECMMHVHNDIATVHRISCLKQSYLQYQLHASKLSSCYNTVT